MSNPVDFYGPDLKTERAEHHIRQLEGIFRAYVREHRNRIRAKTQNYNRHRPVKLGGSLPRHTPTVIGDAIHNLRASLDHAYCLLVEANGGAVDRTTYFPFGGDPNSIKGTVDAAIQQGKGPSERIRDVIVDEIQPFPGGKGERLYGIHKLDITDKHRVLIPTMAKLNLQGQRITLPNGNVIIGGNFFAINDKAGRGPLIDFGPGAKFEPNDNAQAPVDICFQRGQPFAGENIVQTLRDLLVLTRGALEVLRAAA